MKSHDPTALLPRSYGGREGRGWKRRDYAPSSANAIFLKLQRKRKMKEGRRKGGTEAPRSSTTV